MTPVTFYFKILTQFAHVNTYHREQTKRPRIPEKSWQQNTQPEKRKAYFAERSGK